MSGLSGGVTVLSGYAAPNDDQISWNNSQSFAAGTTTITPTTGKHIFVSKIVISRQTGLSGALTFLDDTDELFRINFDGLVSQVISDFNFFVPLEFVTNLKVVVPVGATVNMSLSGFEQ